MELPPVVVVNPSEFPDLDLTRPDHKIVAEYATIRRKRPDLLILSDDTLLVLAARSLGFAPILIPGTWKLETEKDERDDEIHRLNEELRSYKQNFPELFVSLLDDGGAETQAIHATIDVYKPSEAEITVATKEVAERYPIETDFNLRPPQPALGQSFAAAMMRQMWAGPRKEDIDRYINESYPNWIERVREAWPRFAERLNALTREIGFKVRIENAGFVNAQNVRLIIRGYDGVKLRGGLNDKSAQERLRQLSLPSLPIPPRGRYVDTWGLAGRGSLLPEHPLFTLPKQPDSHAFYFKDGRPTIPIDELELGCSAFPHQGEPYDLDFRAIVPSKGVQPGARFSVRIEASNLKRPIQKFVPMSATFEKGDFIEVAKTAKPEQKK